MPSILFDDPEMPAGILAGTLFPLWLMPSFLHCLCRGRGVDPSNLAELLACLFGVSIHYLS